MDLIIFIKHYLFRLYKSVSKSEQAYILSYKISKDILILGVIINYYI